MNEEELKATIGEAAFNAMSAEARASLITKFANAGKQAKDEGGKKTGKKAAASDDDGEEDDEEEDDGDSGDLHAKAKKARRAADERQNETRVLEDALRFNLGVQDFVKSNADLLPEATKEILEAAEKEKYDSATEKASALKKAFIDAFFEIQANVELLTTAQKRALDDYGKLTVNGKKARAHSIFENILEPTLETLRKVKKAEELGKARSGFASSNKVEDAYKARLISGAKKAFFGEKGA